MRVDSNWSFIDYDYIKWNEINQPDQYKLLPEFLYPYQSVLREGECGITRTKRGDLIIYDRTGLLASYRKGFWKIYEVTSIKNTIKSILGGHNHWMASNLFEMLFDLSYRRHGALIIIDKASKSEQFINNELSLINNGSTGSKLHQALSNRLQGICLNDKDLDKISKPLLLELASIDGALVFDNKGKIISFGSMIKTHEKATTEFGARSSAALSAFYNKALAFKVSSDGEISLFISKDKKGSPEKITFI